MWCGLGKSGMTIAVTSLVTASLVVADTTFAARQRNYTPEEFRAVLRGLGYDVKVTNTTLTDEETRKAIREFQRGYKLTVDGVAGPQTQDFAATIVQILQANLNAVLQPDNPLPRDQFYRSQTEAAVREAQKKFQMEETGIADLRFRQRLNEEARKIITQPTPKPTAKPTPTPTPTPRATPRATPTPTPR
ncbi:peptidoglycan-binding domain-containing protein, partial [Nodularia spumigena CS-584]|uniref:peptidoglycan-binding domain-containing protein n=1 Tax=Nodularia spumigena TaxID=70799 RepID=UPI00233139BE